MKGGMVGRLRIWVFIVLMNWGSKASSKDILTSGY